MPTDRARADAGEDDAGCPRLSHYVVDVMQSPQRKQIRDRTAADVDDVLCEQVLAHVGTLGIWNRDR